jgi:hypothetical protein
MRLWLVQETAIKPKPKNAEGEAEQGPFVLMASMCACTGMQVSDGHRNSDKT